MHRLASTLVALWWIFFVPNVSINVLACLTVGWLCIFICKTGRNCLICTCSHIHDLKEKEHKKLHRQWKDTPHIYHRKETNLVPGTVEIPLQTTPQLCGFGHLSVLALQAHHSSFLCWPLRPQYVSCIPPLFFPFVANSLSLSLPPLASSVLIVCARWPPKPCTRCAMFLPHSSMCIYPQKVQEVLRKMVVDLVLATDMKQVRVTYRELDGFKNIAQENYLTAYNEKSWDFR